jgi:hypothetical protein
MNWISPDAVIRNVNHNIALQNYNQDIQNKLGNNNTWLKNFEQQREHYGEYKPAGMVNNYRVEDDLSKYTVEKQKVAPDVFIKMKSERCPCGTELQSSNGYICTCDLESEKTEKGKPQEKFQMTINDKNANLITISVSRHDVYVVAIVIASIIAFLIMYKFYNMQLRTEILRCKYKKIKKYSKVKNKKYNKFDSSESSSSEYSED